MQHKLNNWNDNSMFSDYKAHILQLLTISNSGTQFILSEYYYYWLPFFSTIFDSFSNKGL